MPLSGRCSKRKHHTNNHLGLNWLGLTRIAATKRANQHSKCSNVRALKRRMKMEVSIVYIFCGNKRGEAFFLSQQLYSQVCEFFFLKKGKKKGAPRKWTQQGSTSRCTRARTRQRERTHIHTRNLGGASTQEVCMRWCTLFLKRQSWTPKKETHLASHPCPGRARGAVPAHSALKWRE